MIAVRLPKEIESRLDNLAKLTGRTKTFYVTTARLGCRAETSPLNHSGKESGPMPL